MGLDMFLESVKEGKIESLYYWRKAYLIMDWFENLEGNIDNLAKYTLDKDDLMRLRDFCKDVLSEGNFNSVKKPFLIWTTRNEIEENSDYHKQTLEDTLNFLDNANLDEYDYFYFFAWW